MMRNERVFEPHLRASNNFYSEIYDQLKWKPSVLVVLQ